MKGQIPFIEHQTRYYIFLAFNFCHYCVLALVYFIPTTHTG